MYLQCKLFHQYHGQSRAVVHVRYLNSRVSSIVRLLSHQSSLFRPSRLSTHPSIYLSSHLVKGPCLSVALIIWTNFLCNLFPSQPPTWLSSIRLLKVGPLIPASPFSEITFPFFPHFYLLCVKVLVQCCYSTLCFCCFSPV